LVHVQDRYITDTKDLENPRRIDNSFGACLFLLWWFKRKKQEEEKRDRGEKKRIRMIVLINAKKAER
jgi:hypothetical protein